MLFRALPRFALVAARVAAAAAAAVAPVVSRASSGRAILAGVLALGPCLARSLAPVGALGLALVSCRGLALALSLAVAPVAIPMMAVPALVAILMLALAGGGLLARRSCGGSIRHGATRSRRTGGLGLAVAAVVGTALAPVAPPLAGIAATTRAPDIDHFDLGRRFHRLLVAGFGVRG